jgi:DNA repair exonuclease SbcCD ATPase subunit
MVRMGRREEPQGSIQTEQQRLQAIRMAAEQELTRLRTELSERVAAVERRERELADALAKVAKGKVVVPKGTDEALSHAQVGLAAHAQELNRREAELAARERAIVELETDLARRAAGGSVDPETRLAQIEARLKALQEAEKAFARTQAELGAQSEELTLRETELAQRERALRAGAAGAGPAAAGGGLTRDELDDLEERLRRLEHETRVASTERGFGDTLRTLERRGLRGTPPNAT